MTFLCICNKDNSIDSKLLCAQLTFLGAVNVKNQLISSEILGFTEACKVLSPLCLLHYQFNYFKHLGKNAVVIRS